MGCTRQGVQVPAETCPPDTWVSSADPGGSNMAVRWARSGVGRGIALGLVWRRQAPPDRRLGGRAASCRSRCWVLAGNADPANAMPSVKVVIEQMRSAHWTKRGSVATANGGSGRYAKVPAQFFI